MPVSGFYSISNKILLILFIIFAVGIATVAVLAFNLILPCSTSIFENGQTETCVSSIAAAIGIVIAFIVTNAWQNYNDAEKNMTQEANLLYLLYQTTSFLENSDEILELIKDYLCFIIQVEFPMMEAGQIPNDNAIVTELKEAIYSYQYNTNVPNQGALYDKALGLLNDSMLLRAERFEDVSTGLALELWWVMVLGYFLVVFITVLLTGTLVSKIILTSFVSVTYAILLFLAVALDYPFRGDFGLGPTPFEFVVSRIGFVCPPIIQ